MVMLLSLVLIIITLPQEQKLGHALKLVYLHGGLSLVAYLWYGLTAILALGFLVTRQKNLLLKGRKFLVVSFWLMLLATITGAITMKITWGAVYFKEPRFFVMVSMLIFTGIAYFAEKLYQNSLISSVFYMLPGIGGFTLRLFSKRIVHPQNPIGESNSFTLKFWFLLVLLNLLALSFYFTQRELRLIDNKK
ncbi:hypothetical protein cpu_02320 [Carboxydothermus pertinax]|uniref:Uncharacterized protein n=2 Tax=Carboxydothermus pertinax TaxID=870242 RepID=A0A1L8CS25_9THEO|nr:hypothetical protein cpu_02320 [Carboxydothermus pertinax]